jgi:integrase
MASGWTRKRGSTWTWYIEDVPDPQTGRSRQISKGGFRTRKEARDALLEAQAALRSGTFVEPSKRTVRSYLLEEWLPDNQPPRLRPSSFANYTNYTRIHVVPRLGDIELQRLSPSNLSAFYRVLLTDARRDGKGLAPKTVRNIHAMLHRALKDAVRLGYLIRNAADAVTPPRGASPEMQVWTPEQLRAFLTHARHDRLYALWLLVATTGMRRAELAGLRWVDIDLDAARLSPRRPRVAVNYVVHESEPKTRMGKRSLALDPATLAALQEHKAQQEQERADVGPAWTDSGLVFTRPDGSPIHPTSSPTGSGDWPVLPACRRFAYMTCAIATPPRRWPPASRPRWSASVLATPPSPSPKTSTATSSPAWTRRPPTPWPASSSAIPTQAKGPDRSPGPPLTND